MIVFIAPFPALSDEKDGMVQRIASIDALVSDLPRVYLDISFRRFWSKRTHHFGEATVFQLNGFLHFFLIVSWLRTATVVYIHSVYNSLKALPAYWIAKPITDLHGAVPEELAHQGKSWLAHLFGLVERIVLRRRAPAVYVTVAMRRHFQQKYERESTADRIIAILPRLEDVRGQTEIVIKASRDVKAVIYAGGLQSWQNVSMMLTAAASVPKFNYIFLSGEVSELQRLADFANVANYNCHAVLNNQVPDYYLKSTYGFILRDPMLLNKVACPTKLVEYLYWGVIPIVLTPEIGDFTQFGFKYVLFKDFLDGKMPDDDMINVMRIVNRKIVDEMLEMAEKEIIRLKNDLRKF